MRKCTAFVLGGGGSRGALQVGAMRALMESGIVPDLLVGSSIGAVNSAGLALWGAGLNGIEALDKAWQDMAGKQILDPRLSQLILRAMMGRTTDHARKRIEEYFVSTGFSHELRFHHIHGVRLGLVSADISSGEPVIYGLSLFDSILEGLLASVALPPWFTPFLKEGMMMVDGGALSNLPIEPAVRLGATEIFALDLDDDSQIPGENLTFMQYMEKYIFAVSKRHTVLEKALAEAQGIDVRIIDFKGLSQKSTWDFRDSQKLIKSGYQKACHEICSWHDSPIGSNLKMGISEKQHA